MDSPWACCWAALGFTIDFYAERRAADYQQALIRHGWLEPAR
jgi:hypothetical protein